MKPRFRAWKRDMKQETWLWLLNQLNLDGDQREFFDLIEDSPLHIKLIEKLASVAEA